MKSKLHVTTKNQDIINLYNQDCKIVKNLRPSSIRNNTVFLRTLQKILGHNDLNTTVVYLDLVGEDIMNDFRKIRW